MSEHYTEKPTSRHKLCPAEGLNEVEHEGKTYQFDWFGNVFLDGQLVNELEYHDGTFHATESLYPDQSDNQRKVAAHKRQQEADAMRAFQESVPNRGDGQQNAQGDTDYQSFTEYRHAPLERVNMPVLVSEMDGLHRKPIIYNGDIGMIFGSPGAGKSTSVLDFLLCRACTDASFRPLWWNKLIVEPGHVLHISSEDREGHMDNRIFDWFERRAKDSLDTARKNYHSNYGHVSLRKHMHLNSLRKYDDTLAQAMLKYLNDHPKAVIAIDPLSGVTGAEENNQTLHEVVTTARNILEQFRESSIVFIHHDSKIAQFNHTVGQEAARGGTTLTAGIRWSLQLTHDVKTDKRTATIVKNNFALGGHFPLIWENGGIDAVTEAEQSRREQQVKKQKQDQKYEDCMTELKEFCHIERSKKEIKENMLSGEGPIHMAKTHVNELIQHAVARNVIFELSNGNYADEPF